MNSSKLKDLQGKDEEVARQKDRTQGAQGGSKGASLELKIKAINGQAKEPLDGSVHNL